MDERLIKNRRDKALNFKVSKKEREDIMKFCEDRDWKLSAFIRVAIEESMAKVLLEESMVVGKEEDHD